ncbi:MAG: site-specific DNA-methyltransferase [Bryobacteraceae bacterium]|jgi:hypothetical protein
MFSRIPAESRNGFVGTEKAKRYSDLFRGGTKCKLGVSRIPDVFVANVSGNSRNVDHPAAFPPTLAEYLIATFSQRGDTILDPFAGSGTTLFVGRCLKRLAIGIELEPKYVELIQQRQAEIEWRDLSHFSDHDIFSLLEPVDLANLTEKDFVAIAKDARPMPFLPVPMLMFEYDTDDKWNFLNRKKAAPELDATA